MPMVEQYLVVGNGKVHSKSDDLQKAITSAMYYVDDVTDHFKLVSIWDQIEKRIVAVVSFDEDGYKCRKLGKEIKQE